MSLVISAAEVNAALGYAGAEGPTRVATDAEVQVAQDLIEIEIDADLATSGQSGRFTAADYRRLRLAVQWQVSYLRANPNVLSERTDYEAASVNGASYRRKQGSTDATVSPVAVKLLRRLSWRKRVKTTLPSRHVDRSLASQDLVHDVGRQPWRPL